MNSNAVSPTLPVMTAVLLISCWLVGSVVWALVVPAVGSVVWALA